MGNIEQKVARAIRAYGCNAVARALDMSREAALSVALGVARDGSVALAARNIGRLDRLDVRAA